MQPDHQYAAVRSCNTGKWDSRQQQGITRQDALPQAVSLPHRRLPQAQGAVLGAAGVQLTIRTEANTVDRTKVALVGFCKKKKKRSTQQALDLEKNKLKKRKKYKLNRCVVFINVILRWFTYEWTKSDSLTQFFLGTVVKFVELEVLATRDKEVLIWVEWGRVDGSWSLHCLDQVQAGKRKLLFLWWLGSHRLLLIIRIHFFTKNRFTSSGFLGPMMKNTTILLLLIIYKN